MVDEARGNHSMVEGSLAEERAEEKRCRAELSQGLGGRGLNRLISSIQAYQSGMIVNQILKHYEGLSVVLAGHPKV